MLSSRQVCEFSLEQKQILCTAKQKLQDKYSDTIVDLENVFSLFFNITLESKLGEFLYNVLNKLYYLHR